MQNWLTVPEGRQVLKSRNSELVCWIRRDVQGGAALPRQGVTISLVPDLDLGSRSETFQECVLTGRELLLSVYEYEMCFTCIWPKLLCSTWNIWRFIEPESKREHNSASMGRGGVCVCLCQELVLVFYMQSSTWVVKTGVSAMHRSRTQGSWILLCWEQDWVAVSIIFNFNA